MLLNKINFFYTDGANEDAGGNADGQQQQQGDGAAKSDEGIKLPEDIEKELTELRGQKSEFEKWKAEKAAAGEKDERTPEQKIKDEEIDKANFRKYSIENDLAKEDDFVKFETLQQKKDSDLVFEGFLNDFKDENPDITDEKELTEAAREEFDAAYKLTSTNEKIKEKGLAKLAKEANEIRNPYSSKISTAKEKYNSEKELAATYASKFVPFTENVKKAIPAKLTYSKLKAGEGEVEIDVDITPEDIKDVEEKFLKNHKTFFKFKEGKPEEVQAKLLEKIQSYLLVKKRDEGNQKVADKFVAIGVANGSNTGADASFAMKQQNNGRKTQTTVTTLEDSNKKMAEARARFN